jgi:transcription elongation factor GreB
MAELPIFITPEGHKKFREEIDWLWREERPRVTDEVQTAAAQGDRSENAEYIYGKKRLGEIDRRLRFLSRRLERMQIIPLEQQRRSDGRAGFGAWVIVEDEGGQRATYRLVGPDETNADEGCISIESPVGGALLGKERGDEVEVHRPKGIAFFTILQIAYGARPS